MPDISHSIDVAAAPGAIYPLVSSGRGFRTWWAEDVIEAPDSGADLGFFDRATIYRLRPERLETDREATWRCESGDEWSGTRLIFELEPRGETTRIRFKHAGWGRASDYFVSCNTTWGELMFRLKAAAEGKAPGPLFKLNSLAY